MSIICATNQKLNLGASKCNKLPSLFAGMITTPAGFSIPVATLSNPAALRTLLQNAIIDGIANRVYLWPSFADVESASEESIYEDTALTDIAVRQGKYRWRVHISKNLCLHRAMFSHSGSGDRAIFFDMNNNFFMTELANGNGAGFRISLLNVEKLLIGDGSVATKTPVYIVLKNSHEIDNGGLMVPAEFVNELIPLSDVSITLSNVVATSMVATAQVACDGTPVSGLVLADFIVQTNAGALQNPTAVTETGGSGSGVYTLARTGSFTSGNVRLRPASQLSVVGFEGVTPVSFTI